ncbi:hypothetical protein KAH55_09230, partial [bacterium]|nr:hypothetical protein [bacterium]
IELEYDADLRATDDVLFFYSPLQTNNARYGLTDFSSDQIQLFDISDYANIKQVSAEKAVNQTLEFVGPCRADSINSYLALTENGYLEPASISADNFISNLRDPANSGDYLIIAPDFFMEQAQRLADYREQYSGFNSKVVDINDVFDEFSAGIQDPVAIRDFLSWAYANWQLAPRLILLFGDGHYDYKNNLGSSFHNWILPYETYEISEGQGRATDEFFTWIYGSDTYDDIAIGRIPCQTLDDATAMVDKIIAYETNPSHGEWKNTITLLADDEFVGNGNFESWNTMHVNDSERLAQSYIPSTFDLSKIYLTEYPAVRSASITGFRKPTASEAFINQINRGTLIMNFIGHANEIVFTDERILTLTDAQQRIDNGANQAFWVAATCEWGRYDMPEAQAMSENILLMPQGGAIGLLASSRTAYAGDNAAISQVFYRQIFPVTNNSYEHGETTMVGEALMLVR